MTWAELFDRADDYDVTVGAIRASLETHRETGTQPGSNDE